MKQLNLDELNEVHGGTGALEFIAMNVAVNIATYYLIQAFNHVADADAAGHDKTFPE